MGHLVRAVLALVVLLPAAGALTAVSHVPPSAFVVPAVEIAHGDEAIRLSPGELGATRTEDGLELNEERFEAAIGRLAESFAAPARPARYERTEGGVALHPGSPGRELDVEGTRSVLRKALNGTDDALRLPVREVDPPAAPPFAIVVELSEFRLRLYEGTTLHTEYPVGIGKVDYPTPPGAYHVASKAANPTWRNPGSAWSRNMPAYVPPGPDNPLGTRALRLDRDAIVIHGTPNPSSVGRRLSHGCVRMHRADVEELFEIVPVGTPVFIEP